jgi:hypothetical protein
LRHIAPQFTVQLALPQESHCRALAFSASPHFRQRAAAGRSLRRDSNITKPAIAATTAAAPHSPKLSQRKIPASRAATPVIHHLLLRGESIWRRLLHRQQV